MIENLDGYHGNTEEENLTNLGQRSLPGGSGVQAELIIGVSLRQMEGKDIPDRSNNISKMVKKKKLHQGLSGTDSLVMSYTVFWGLTFTLQVRDSPSVSRATLVFLRSFRDLFQQGGGVGLGIGPGSERHHQFPRKFYLRYLKEGFHC